MIKWATKLGTPLLAVIVAIGWVASSQAAPETAVSTAPNTEATVPGALTEARPNAVPDSLPVPVSEKVPLLKLGPGDSVTMAVYGQADMTTTVYVSDDGTIPVALVGPVQVGGLSPSQAGARIEKALRDAKILVDPHVTLTVTLTRSQRVSVLGQVGTPGRYPIDSGTSIFDLLAQAGGIAETGSDVIYIFRTDASGKQVRYPVNLKFLADSAKTVPTEGLQGGDSVFVPRAEQFYIYGEVAAAGKFRVEPGMTVIQAIVRAGGITLRGSQRRVEIKRQLADGSYVNLKAKLTDPVQPDDVIRVKESIF